MRKLGIFKPADEWVNLLLPLLVLLAAAAAFVAGVVPPQHTTLEFIIKQYLFMNILHIVFNFIAISRFPEFKGALKGFGGRLLIFSAAVFAIFWFIGTPIRSVAPLGHAAEALLWLMFIVVPVTHGHSQIRGLSFIYNFHLRRPVPQESDSLKRARRAETRERRAFTIMTAAYILVLTSLPSRNLFLLNDLIRPWVAQASLVILIGAVFFIFVNSWLYPGARRSNKPVFLLRLLLLPLAPFSLIAAAGLAIMHGTESLMIFRKMASRSDAAKAGGGIWVLCFGSAFAVLVLSLYQLNRDIDYTSFGPRLNDSIFMTLVYAHYYLDSKIYGLSDARLLSANRKLLIEGASGVNTPDGDAAPERRRRYI